MPTEPTFDANGMRRLTLPEIRQNMVDAIHAAGELGPQVSTGSHTLTGMILDVVAAGLDDLYALAEDIYSAWDIDAAEGVQLDNLEGLRRIDRDEARYSTVTLTISGTASTNIPAGTKYAVPNGGPQFATDVDATIGGGGTVDVAATCTEAGPHEAAAGSITEIIDAISGVTGVTNAADATPGENVESDTDFRERGEDASTGSTTEDAVYTRLLDLDFVDAAVVISNRSDETDANGIPPHSFWIVLWPSTADSAQKKTIAETIHGVAGTSAGIGFKGAQTATVIDANGHVHTIAWDWATEVEVHCRVDVTTDDDYPTGGDDLIEDAVVEYGDTLRVSQDVYNALVAANVLTDVPGIKTIQVYLKIGATPGTGDDDPIDIAINELGDIDSTDVTVNSS